MKNCIRKEGILLTSLLYVLFLACFVAKALSQTTDKLRPAPLQDKQSDVAPQISSPTQILPPKYPSVQMSKDAPIEGELVYSLRLLHKFIIFQSPGIANNVHDKESTFAAYPVEANDVVYDPQFSYDGQSLFFKVGWLFDFPGKYNLYQWDFANQDVKFILSNMDSRNIYPSPDNKWVAYVNNGEEEDGSYSSSLRYLAAVNLKTGTEIRLKNNPALNSVSWTSLDTILFTMPPAGGKTTAPPIKDEPGKYDWTKLPHPAIYEASPMQQLSVKLIDDASNSLPSPDGNQIAYFGWSDKMTGVSKSTLEAESKGGKPPHQVLALFDRKTGSSKLLQDTLPDSVLWTRDGKQIIALNITTEKLPDGDLQDTATIKLINVSTLQSKQLVQVKATDFKGAVRSEAAPHFELMKVTNDGKYLLLKTSAYTGPSSPGDIFYAETLTLEAIDLHSGKMDNVAKFDNKWAMVNGWDWHDMSTPAS